MTRVSLLVPNRDNAPVLDLVLERLAAHTTYPDVELVVVDDGSTDGSREILRRWRDSGRFERFVYEEQAPSGVVVTLNRCLELATGEVCVQLDADATVETTGWIEKMLDLLTLDERVGVVTAKVVMDSGVVHAYGVNLVGPEGFHDRGTTPTEPAGARTYHQRVERLPEGAAPYGDAVAEVDTGIGVCQMFRRADALAVGGYDLGFQPVWFDDLDLGLSIRHRLGKKVFFLPSVRVTHRVSARAGAPTFVGLVVEKVGQLVPPALKALLTRRFGLDLPRGAVAERLAHHRAYWRSKWGWDMLNPDMAAVRDRYAGTEVLWASDPEMRAAGADIAAAYEAGHGADTAAAAHRFVREWGFLPPPAWSTLQDWTHILGVVRSRDLGALDGDFVEIGVFLGGGVYQLARLAPARRVVAIDIFAPGVDVTETAIGSTMAGIYRHVLGTGDQRELFDAVVASLDNVDVVVGDSATVEIPVERIAFAHIDGNHDPEYVRSDFERLWPLVVSGGVLAFDDYGYDLPQVTAVIDEVRAERAAEIAEFWTAGQKTAFLAKR